MHVYETQDKAISNVKYQKEGKKKNTANEWVKITSFWTNNELRTKDSSPKASEKEKREGTWGE